MIEYSSMNLDQYVRLNWVDMDPFLVRLIYRELDLSARKDETIQCAWEECDSGIDFAIQEFKRYIFKKIDGVRMRNVTIDELEAAVEDYV